jgi:hypothetical protein
MITNQEDCETLCSSGLTYYQQILCLLENIESMCQLGTAETDYQFWSRSYWFCVLAEFTFVSFDVFITS